MSAKLSPAVTVRFVRHYKGYQPSGKPTRDPKALVRVAEIAARAYHASARLLNFSGCSDDISVPLTVYEKQCEAAGAELMRSGIWSGYTPHLVTPLDMNAAPMDAAWFDHLFCEAGRDREMVEALRAATGDGAPRLALLAALRMFAALPDKSKHALSAACGEGGDANPKR